MFSCLAILACSGSGAPAAIANSVMFARCMIGVSAALALLSLAAYLFVHRFFFLVMGQLLLTAFHPSLWDSGQHGDCGLAVVGNSWTWMIVGTGLLVAQYVGRFLPPRPTGPLRGFPVIMSEEVK